MRPVAYGDLPHCSVPCYVPFCGWYSKRALLAACHTGVRSGIVSLREWNGALMTLVNGEEYRAWQKIARAEPVW